jgi:hypothetical protein
MNHASKLRNKHQQLKRKPGPRGWIRRAARELEYSPGYISRLSRGLVSSPAAEAALREWKQLNAVA